MKNAISIAALCIVGAAAHAQTGGFTGPDNRKVVTVAEATELPDDTMVRLVGYITESAGDENYVFSDDTGTIVVEIDSDEWNGLEVTPTVQVEIAGEVDKERNGNEIDVDTIKLAN